MLNITSLKEATWGYQKIIILLVPCKKRRPSYYTIESKKMQGHRYDHSENIQPKQLLEWDLTENLFGFVGLFKHQKRDFMASSLSS